MHKNQHADNAWQAWAELHRWYSGPLGRKVAAAEAARLQDILPWLFGYHIVAVGLPAGSSLLAASRIGHQVHLDCIRPAAGARPDLLAQPDQLPIASDSVDVVVLSHVLEFVDDPQAVLREVERILIAEGHAVIAGFNPLSLWGLSRITRLHGGRLPWDGRLLRVSRLRNWLSQAGLTPVDVQYCFYRPPVGQPGLLSRLAFLERWGGRWWPSWGGAYLLLVKKRVTTLTLIKPAWQARRKILPGGVAGRASRNHN